MIIAVSYSKAVAKLATDIRNVITSGHKIMSGGREKIRGDREIIIGARRYQVSYPAVVRY